MKGDFKYEYDTRNNEWVAKFNGNVLMTVEESVVASKADYDAVAEGDAFREIVAEELLTRMENEDNGFFVSAFLSKMFNYGMNWTKEVR
jgi:hypothetical protein